MTWFWEPQPCSAVHWPLSYTIPWRSGSYTCFSNQSEAENMADLTPSPWQLVPFAHGNYHWPTAISSIKQSHSPSWIFAKNFYKYTITMFCDVWFLHFWTFYLFTKKKKMVTFCFAYCQSILERKDVFHPGSVAVRFTIIFLLFTMVKKTRP